MRKNYFEKLINYMKNVYHIDYGLSKLTDGRVNPKYKTSQVIAPVLIGFLLRIRSFNELNLMIKENEFRKLFSKGNTIPMIDTIRDTLKVIDIDRLKQINQHIVKKAVKNKVFDNGTIDGYTVVAIDGTKFFGSDIKSCDECLKTSKGDNTHYFHSGAVMSTDEEGSKLVIDFEMYKPSEDLASKDEGELNVSKRLIAGVVSNHKKLIDIVIYDALACNSVWINHCINLGTDIIVRAKNNNNNNLRRVKKKANKSKEVAVWKHEKEFEEVKVYEETFTMDNVEQPLRFIKFAMKYPDKKRSQIMLVTTCIDMSFKTLFKIVRARWDIESAPQANKLEVKYMLKTCA